jgi:hypothetical protein
MHAHRFLNHIKRISLPETAVAQLGSNGFAWLPSLFAAVGVMQQWQYAVYQRAFAEAQAVVRPSLPERDLLGVWN